MDLENVLIAQDETFRDYDNVVACAVSAVAERRFSAEQKPMMGPAIVATIQEVSSEADEWLGEFLRFIDDGRQDAEDLERLIARFVNLFAQIDSLPLLRPWVFVVKGFRQIITEVQSLVVDLLDFHRAADSVDYGGVVQSTEATIRRINKRSEELGEALGVWGNLVTSSHPDEALVRLSAEIGLGAGATVREMEQYFYELKVRSDECFTEITGEASSCPEGLDMLLLIARRQVEFLGDVENFLSIAQRAYRYMMSRPEKARLMAESPDWLQGLSSGLALSYFDGDTASAVVAATRTEPGLLGGLLNLGKDIVESWSRLPVSTLLALRSRTLEHWQRQDAGATLKAANQGDVAALVAGFPIAIRNAAAHHSWQLVDSEIVFVDSRGEARLAMKWPELINALLAGAENYTALIVGLSSAAAVMGSSMTPLVEAAKVHLPYDLLIRSIAAFAGYAELEIEEIGERLVIKIPGIPIGLRIIGVAGSFAAFAPDRLKELEVVSTDGRSFVSGIEPLCRWLYERRPNLKHGMLWGMAGCVKVGSEFMFSKNDYEIIIARCAFNFLNEYSAAEARAGLKLALPAMRERSSRLYRAVSVLITDEQVRSGTREEKSLLVWLARRASLPMPEMPGWY